MNTFSKSTEQTREQRQKEKRTNKRRLCTRKRVAIFRQSLTDDCERNESWCRNLLPLALLDCALMVRGRGWHALHRAQAALAPEGTSAAFATVLGTPSQHRSSTNKFHEPDFLIDFFVFWLVTTTLSHPGELEFARCRGRRHKTQPHRKLTNHKAETHARGEEERKRDQGREGKLKRNQKHTLTHKQVNH